MRLNRYLPLVLLAIGFFYSSSLKSLKFISFYEPLVIKALKNSPPHIAFEEIFGVVQNVESSEESLTTTVNLNTDRSSAPLFAKKIELAELVIQAPVERLDIRSMASNNEAGDEWIQELSKNQARRLREAEFRGVELEDNWQGDTWTDHARQVLTESATQQQLAKLNLEPPKVDVYKIDDQGRKVREVPLAEVRMKDPLSYGRTESTPTQHGKLPIKAQNPSSPAQVEENAFMPSFVGSEAPKFTHLTGPIEITGGLAITNDHYIEIRRRDEGIAKELGRVDLNKGTYSIDVENLSGEVVARLLDRSGRVLGEGITRINPVTAKNSGDRVRIEPQIEYAGTVAGLYNSGHSQVAPKGTHATLIKGITDVAVKSDGIVGMENVAKGSFTVLRAAAPLHSQTTRLIQSGVEFKADVFPLSMVQALKDIVESQRGIILADNFPVIWGQVNRAGKAISGVEVILESDSSIEPIYFNTLMLPDTTLQSTSENGYFAFVGVSPGFHSLFASLGDDTSYANAVVEESSVAQVEVEFAKRKETIPLRVFDAFAGVPVPSKVAIQSISEEVETSTGATSITLPFINRLGLLYPEPLSREYIQAKYLYNDRDAFIHIPLVKYEWLSAIKNFLRISDHPTAGTIIGFVPDQDFEVYLADGDRYEAQNIVYFDMQGRILENRRGIAGGGFIMYNLPADVHEVVVLGQQDRKVQSKVSVVDPSSVSVLSFRN